MPMRVATRRSLKPRKHVRIWFEAQNRAAKADIPAQLTGVLTGIGAHIDNAVDVEMGNEAAERDDLAILMLTTDKTEAHSQLTIAQLSAVAAEIHARTFRSENRFKAIS